VGGGNGGTNITCLSWEKKKTGPSSGGGGGGGSPAWQAAQAVISIECKIVVRVMLMVISGMNLSHN
jgi:hypothetical protein